MQRRCVAAKPGRDQLFSVRANGWPLVTHIKQRQMNRETLSCLVALYCSINQLLILKNIFLHFIQILNALGTFLQLNTAERSEHWFHCRNITAASKMAFLIVKYYSNTSFPSGFGVGCRYYIQRNTSCQARKKKKVKSRLLK